MVASLKEQVKRTKGVQVKQADIEKLANYEEQVRSEDNESYKPTDNMSYEEFVQTEAKNPLTEEIVNRVIQKIEQENRKKAKTAEVENAEQAVSLEAPVQDAMGTSVVSESKAEGVYDTENNIARKVAYSFGKSGVPYSCVVTSETTSTLTDEQRTTAYEEGLAAANRSAETRELKNKSLINGKTGRRKGVVKSEGVTISELPKSFNDTQGKAYSLLSTYAEVTGVDIVLYRSKAGSDGAFKGAQGKFNFVQELAEEHKSLFRSILDHLKEFLSQLKSYFNEMGHNRSREANALKEQVGDTVRYVDSIVNMFDKAAVQAVRNYQATVATDETASSTDITEDEDAALLSYKSGGSYLLNQSFGNPRD